MNSTEMKTVLKIFEWVSRSSDYAFLGVLWKEDSDLKSQRGSRKVYCPF